MGNLGVVQLKYGMPGSAMETWMKGASTNPDYDVNWYNLYSITKSNGQIGPARNYLVNALRSKTCHFPKQWKDELEEIDRFILYSQKFGHIQAYYNQIKGDVTKLETVKALEQAIAQINSMSKFIEAETAQQNQGLIQRLEEINRSIAQLDLMKTGVVKEQESLKGKGDAKTVMDNQQKAIDMLLDRVVKETGKPVMLQMPPPLEGSPQPQQVIQPQQPKVLDVNAAGGIKPQSNNPQSDSGRPEPEKVIKVGT